MEIISFDGLSLYYETCGDPSLPALVLLHGIGADHRMWQPQYSTLSQAGFFLIIPDLRGHGSSQAPADFRIKDCARDIHDLLEKQHIQKTHLAGVSMGGMLAQQISADYPEMVLSQVLVDSLSGVTRPVERFNAGLAALLLKIFPPRFQGYLMSSTYKKLGHEDIGEYFRERVLAMDPKWLLNARLEVNRFNVLERLPEMQIPTLVLVGDAFGKMAVDMARTTAENIPGAEFEILPGGGDPSNLLVPQLFDQALLHFLNKFLAADI